MSRPTKDVQKIIQAYERREEIVAGRPLLWGLQMGLIALTVTAAWLLLRGDDLDAVLIRSAAALAAFAIAGYAAGRLLEQPPVVKPDDLVEPGDPEEESTGVGRLPFADLRPGMVLAEPVRKADGEVLVEAGTTLSLGLVEVLKEYEISHAVVKREEGGEKHHDESD